jgi:uncharacterized protein (TIGR03437 family)
MDIAVDACGNVYLAGQTSSANFPVTSAAYQTKYPAQAASNGFAAKFSFAPSISAVLNAASLQANGSGAVAPGEIVTINGTSLGPADAAVFQAAGGTPDTTLGGTQVLFDDTPAALLSVQADQITAIVPYEIAGASSTKLRVVVNGTSSCTMAMPVTDVVPGIFTQDQSGSGAAMILNADGTTNSVAHPAAIGSVVTIAATGEGQTNPPGIDGQLASDTPPVPLQSISVQIGDVVDAEVMYAGGTPGLPAGFFKVMVTIPPDAPSGAAVPISLNIGSTTSQSGVTIAIQ